MVEDRVQRVIPRLRAAMEQRCAVARACAALPMPCSAKEESRARTPPTATPGTVPRRLGDALAAAGWPARVQARGEGLRDVRSAF
eukprot:5595637-Prymnesium_polylepis.1